MENIPVTQETYDQLVQELENLKKVERPHIISEIADARAQGDLKENAEYHAAKDRQGEIESRIHHLEDKIARSIVIAYDPSKSDSVKFGATVDVKNVKTGKKSTYQLISPEGVDPINGKISFKSPIGKALIGKTRGEIAEVALPNGTVNKLEIIDYR